MLKVNFTEVVSVEGWKPISHFEPGDILESENIPGSIYMLLEPASTGGGVVIDKNTIVCLDSPGFVYKIETSRFRKVKSATLNVAKFPR